MTTPPMNVDLRAHTKRLGSNDYIMVSGRVLLAHANNAALTIETDVVGESDELIRVKAVVTTDKGTFTGHAESKKRSGGQEGKTPLEVAETSAIGRALGFAGYAVENGIASAEEVERNNHESPPQPPAAPRALPNAPQRPPQPQQSPQRKEWGQLINTSTKRLGLKREDRLTLAKVISAGRVKQEADIPNLPDEELEALAIALQNFRNLGEVTQFLQREPVPAGWDAFGDWDDVIPEQPQEATR